MCCVYLAMSGSSDRTLSMSDLSLTLRKLRLIVTYSGTYFSGLWISIHFTSWIRMQYADPDPDPGG